MKIALHQINIVERNKLEAYRELFPDKAHLWFAAHLAFPIALTSDLAYKIWLNFQQEDTPLSMVADILSSPICRKIGNDLYEIYPSIRKALLAAYKKEDEKAVLKFERLAQFLIAYLDFSPEKIPSNVFNEAQRWVAKSYLKPEEAAKDIINAYNNSVENKNAKGDVQMYLDIASDRNSLISKDGASVELDSLQVVTKIVEWLQKIKANNTKQVIDEGQEFQTYFDKKQGTEGYNLLLPEVVLERFGMNQLKLVEKEVKDELGEVNEIKIILVGEEGGGKTSLARLLVNIDARIPDYGEITNGIDIHQWNFEYKNKQYRANIWDFGGQEIYRLLHQYFYSKNALYLLISRTDGSFENSYIEYLETIKFHIEKSPLFFIQNTYSGFAKAIPINRLREKYPFVKEYFQVNSLRYKNNINAVGEAIKDFISNMVANNIIPIKWRKVRARLNFFAQMNEIATLENFRKICVKEGIKRHYEQESVLEYFHQIGILTHHGKNPMLKNLIILNQKWLFNAIYKVYDNRQTVNSKAIFNKNELFEIWQDKNTINHHSYLLEIMWLYGICYKLKNKIFIPSLLEKMPTAIDFCKVKLEQEEKIYSFYYKYDFIPYKIISNLIVALYGLLSGDKFLWSNGIVIQNNKADTVAEILESRVNNRISIRIAGNNIPQLKAIIMNRLDVINAEYESLKVTVKVPCICDKCQLGIGNKTTFSYQQIQDFLSKEKYYTFCLNSRDEVSTHKLLGDFSTESFQTSPPTKVFISYTWDSEEHKNWVLNLANRLMEEGIYVILDQYEIRAGNNLNNFIEKAITAADKVIIILTEKYKNKAEKHNGEGIEYSMLDARISQLQGSKIKFIPVIRGKDRRKCIPSYLNSFILLTMDNDDTFDLSFNQLVREIDIKIINKRELGATKDYSVLGAKVRAFISQNELEKALKLLSTVDDEATQAEANLLLGKLARLKREARLGMITYNTKITERTKIAAAILEVAAPLGTYQEKDEPQIDEKEESSAKNEKIPSRVPTILFAAANPSNKASITTDLEHRIIKEEIVKGHFQDAFDFLAPQLVVRITDLIRAFKQKPDVLHFTGHGDADGIVITDDNNRVLPLNEKITKRLFRPLIGQTKLIILNSCLSSSQAKLISTIVRGALVIGNHAEILDEAAIAFAKGFYIGLSEGMSYKDAYNDGVTVLLTEEDDYTEVWFNGEQLDW